MKSRFTYVLGLGLIGLALPSGARAANPVHGPQRQQEATAQPAAATAAQTELKQARAAYKAAVKAHGKKSPEAQAALRRVQDARAACKTAKQEQKNAPIQGGAGKTGGDMNSGQMGY